MPDNMPLPSIYKIPAVFIALATSVMSLFLLTSFINILLIDPPIFVTSKSYLSVYKFSVIAFEGNSLTKSVSCVLMSILFSTITCF